MLVHSPSKKAPRAKRRREDAGDAFQKKHMVQISLPATRPLSLYNLVAVVGQVQGLVVTFFKWNRLVLRLRDHRPWSRDLQLPFPTILH